MTEPYTEEHTPEENKLFLTSFNTNYKKVLDSLDELHRGSIFDADDSMQIAALCLITQSALIRVQADAEFRARSLKRDIDFAKAAVYARLKQDSPDKKITESSLTQLVNIDSDVHRLYQDQNVAEREAKELGNVLLLLRDAHVTFRSIAKKGE